jgi:flagellar basal-body rod protein FlgC
MALISSFFPALSGLRAASIRQDVSAHNVANVNTDGFKASRVVQSEAPGGGTEISDIRPTGAPAVFYMQQGQVTEGSNVDLAAEITGQIGTLRSFQASLATLRSSDEMTEDLLDAL